MASRVLSECWVIYVPLGPLMTIRRSYIKGSRIEETHDRYPVGRDQKKIIYMKIDLLSGVCEYVHAVPVPMLGKKTSQIPGISGGLVWYQNMRQGDTFESGFSHCPERMLRNCFPHFRDYACFGLNQWTYGLFHHLKDPVISICSSVRQVMDAVNCGPIAIASADNGFSHWILENVLKIRKMRISSRDRYIQIAHLNSLWKCSSQVGCGVYWWIDHNLSSERAFNSGVPTLSFFNQYRSRELGACVCVCVVVVVVVVVRGQCLHGGEEGRATLPDDHHYTVHIVHRHYTHI